MRISNHTSRSFFRESVGRHVSCQVEKAINTGGKTRTKKLSGKTLDWLSDTHSQQAERGLSLVGRREENRASEKWRSHPLLDEGPDGKKRKRGSGWLGEFERKQLIGCILFVTTNSRLFVEFLVRQCGRWVCEWIGGGLEGQCQMAINHWPATLSLFGFGSTSDRMVSTVGCPIIYRRRDERSGRTVS